MLLCIQIWSDLFILELERQKEQIFSFWNIQFCNWMTLKNYDKYNNTCFPSVYYYIFTFHFSTIFRFDSWWTDDCFKFQVSRMSGTPSKTSLSTISRLDPWRTGVPDAPSGGIHIMVYRSPRVPGLKSQKDSSLIRYSSLSNPQSAINN